MSDPDAFSLTPEQATQALADRAAEFRGPPPSANPTTPAEATARLDALRGDRDFYDKLMSGNADTRREFDRLNELASRDNRLDAAMSENPEFPMMETTDAEHPLTTRELASVVESFREAGLANDVIKDVLEGKPVSAEERQAVQRFKNMRFGDSDWVRKLQACDHEAKREHLLMSSVLWRDVADQ